MNEAGRPAPAGTTFFDSLLGLAIRRWCAPVLDLEPHATPEEYLNRRRQLGVEASRRLVVAAGVETFLVDTGLYADVCSPPELAALAHGRAYEIVRLERLVEDLLLAGVAPSEAPERVDEALRTTSAVGAKSVAAYRVGLDLPAHKPSTAELVSALEQLRPSPSSGSVRIAHPVVHGWLAWTAIQHGLPLQIHCGLGDTDLDLRLADPLRLTAFLRATQEQAVPITLLHNYPFHRHAAYLAQVFSHVYLDVGLAVHNVGARSRAVIAEALELAPIAKLLFSTDAYGLAELYFLGAHLFRRGFDHFLTDLVAADELTIADADRFGILVAQENARRIYRL